MAESRSFYSAKCPKHHTSLLVGRLTATALGGCTDPGSVYGLVAARFFGTATWAASNVEQSCLQGDPCGSNKPDALKNERLTSVKENTKDQGVDWVPEAR